MKRKYIDNEKFVIAWEKHRNWTDTGNELGLWPGVVLNKYKQLVRNGVKLSPPTNGQMDVAKLNALIQSLKK